MVSNNILFHLLFITEHDAKLLRLLLGFYQMHLLHAICEVK